jgi:hypothetical protein
LAAVLNIATAYFAKASEGMTHPRTTAGVVVTILLTQFLVARVLSSGGQVAAAIVTVVVAVMVGSGLIGYFFLANA